MDLNLVASVPVVIKKEPASAGSFAGKGLLAFDFATAFVRCVGAQLLLDTQQLVVF